MSDDTSNQSPEKKTRSVVFYLVIMFAFALLLLLLSFFIQQRNHEALVEDFSGSALHVQKLVDLELEKQRLEEEIEQLETALRDSEAAKVKLQKELDALALEGEDMPTEETPAEPQP